MYIVTWNMNGRQTVWTFDDMSKAGDHFTELVGELPPNAQVRLYEGRMISSASHGCCAGCPTVLACQESRGCAQLTIKEARG